MALFAQLGNHLRHTLDGIGEVDHFGDLQRHKRLIQRVDVPMGHRTPQLRRQRARRPPAAAQRLDAAIYPAPSECASARLMSISKVCLNASTKICVGAKEPKSTVVPAQSRITALICFMVNPY